MGYSRPIFLPWSEPHQVTPHIAIVVDGPFILHRVLSRVVGHLGASRGYRWRQRQGKTEAGKEMREEEWRTIRTHRESKNGRARQRGKSDQEGVTVVEDVN